MWLTHIFAAVACFAFCTVGSKTSFDIQVAWQSITQGGAAIASLAKEALEWAIGTDYGSGADYSTSYPSSVNASNPDDMAHPSYRRRSAQNPDRKRHRFDVRDPSGYHHEADYHHDVSYRDRPDLREKIIEVAASSDTYAKTDMCTLVANETGWLEPGFTNYAVFGGLAPNTRFYYAVRSAEVGTVQVQVRSRAPDCGGSTQASTTHRTSTAWRQHQHPVLLLQHQRLVLHQQPPGETCRPY